MIREGVFLETKLIRETIITAMQRRELTAYALGKLAGVDPGVVKRFVDGKLQIKSDNLELLSLRWSCGSDQRKSSTPISRRALAPG